MCLIIIKSSQRVRIRLAFRDTGIRPTHDADTTTGMNKMRLLIVRIEEFSL